MRSQFDQAEEIAFIQQFEHARQEKENKKIIKENLNTAVVLGLQNRLFVVWLSLWVDLVKKDIDEESNVPVIGRESIYTRFVIELTKRVLIKAIRQLELK